MLEFEWPWLLAFLPLPLVVRYLLPPVPRQNSSLRVPRLESFMLNNQASSVSSVSLLKTILIVLAWILLVIATAQPRWVDDIVELPTSGRDLMLAVDLSKSMETRDFKINGRTVDRLTASKYVVSEFIERRSGDRLGLILFGDQAYLQAPLTFDLVTIETLLKETFIGLAGSSTAIGDAIAIAIKRLQEGPSEAERILILVTDGANTSGAIAPEKAAELAALAKLKIYTIGIGADSQIVETWFGRREYNPSKDLDEKTLKLIADKTGGRYFRARDTEEFRKIYDLIDQLEPVEQDQAFFRPSKQLFYWPLSLMLACFVLYALLLVMERGFVSARTDKAQRQEEAVNVD